MTNTNKNRMSFSWAIEEIGSIYCIGTMNFAAIQKLWEEKVRT